MMTALRKFIETEGMTQADTAKWLKVTQPRISDAAITACGVTALPHHRRTDLNLAIIQESVDFLPGACESNSLPTPNRLRSVPRQRAGGHFRHAGRAEFGAFGQAGGEIGFEDAAAD